MRRRRFSGRRFGGGRVNLKAVANAAARGARRAIRGPRSKKGKMVWLLAAGAVVFLFWGKIKQMFAPKA